jgi:1,4-alpha-glucan branching enzyme
MKLRVPRRCWHPALLLWLASSWAAAQSLLTVSPTFPTATSEITLTFDLKQAKDGRAAALLGKTSDVYLWAWGGSDPANRTAEFGPTGQSNFNQAYPAAALTSLGNDRWQIRLRPSTYLNVPAGRALRWMGVLVKNGAGTAQTEDLTFDLYEDRLNVAFVPPIASGSFVEAGGTVPVTVRASRRATLSVLLDGVPLATATDTLLRVEVPTGTTPGVVRTVRATATSGTETASTEFTFTVRPTSPVAALPANTPDGITYRSGSRATLVLFAPQKQFVYVLGDFNDLTPRPEYLMKRTPDGQRFWLDIDGLEAGREYAFQYWVDGQIGTGDPYAEKVLDRANDRFIPAATYPNLRAFPERAIGNVVSVLQPGKAAYAWQSTGYQRPAPEKLVIYELLVRDFLAAGNYAALTDSIAYLKRLGVNAVELMPVNEFSGNDSWGYNPTYFLAPDKAYGTEQALKRFVDECHRAGIAVILDVVFNHADFEFPYVKMYWDGNRPSASSPMFNPEATHPFSVFYDFNHDSPSARAYFDRVLAHWLREYRIDGFRFDLSKGFTQKRSTDDNVFRQYDASRIANIKRLVAQMRTVDAAAYAILEHFAEDSEEQEYANDGMLVWANLNGAFRNLQKGFSDNVNRLTYPSHGFTRPAVVGYAESHDEERLIYDAQQNGRTEGTYSAKDTRTALERGKALAALLLLTPGPKMIWQFGEFGYDVSINQNGRTGRKPLRWEYLQDADRRRLFQVYAELIRLKTSLPMLSTPREFAYRVRPDGLHQLDVLGAPNGTQPTWLRVLANLAVEARGTQPFSLAPSGASASTWFDYFTGEAVPEALTTGTQEVVFRPGEFHVFVNQPLARPAAGLVPWGALSLLTALEPTADAWLKLFPNPGQQVLVVEWESAYRGTVDLEISNAAGQRLNTFQPRKTDAKLTQHLPIESLPRGMYFLKVREGQTQRVKKFVKE